MSLSQTIKLLIRILEVLGVLIWKLKVYQSHKCWAC